MSTAAHYPHIEYNESGEAIIAETGYGVKHLAAEHYHHGWTAEELLRQHPDLRPEQVYAALVYFYDHYDAIVGTTESSLADSEVACRTTFSRQELLERRNNGSH